MIAAAFAVGIASPGLTQPASTPTIQAVAVLQPGQWELRSRGASAATKSMCLNDMRALLQVQHGAAACNRFVTTNDPRQAVVNYTCARAGHGQTSLRVETPRLVQIQTQGIADNEPFAFEFEGRRVGACATSTSTTPRPQSGTVKGKLTFKG
jgi:hypothetical protein